MTSEDIDKWFKVAQSFERFSEDPSTKVGAVIIGHARRGPGRLRSYGWNQLPPNISKDVWNDRERKLKVVWHAEVVAFMDAPDCNEATLVVSQHICAACAQSAIRRGIERVVCPEQPWRDDPSVYITCELARSLLAKAGVELVHVK